MAIHRIEASPNFVVYTGDAGAEAIDKAIRDELNRYCLNLENNLLLKKEKEDKKKVAIENKQKQKDLMIAFVKSLK